MRTLVHLSDIHFGRVDYSTINPLVEAVRGVRPDLVAVSGDLTQRARATEFEEARAFLDALPSPEIAVLGVNTARSLTVKGGRINRDQVAHIRERLCNLGDQVVRIVVTHHPFDLPEDRGERDLVGRARLAMETLADCGADVLLAGHLHTGHTGSTAARYGI